MTACRKHMYNPVTGYNPCPGCEIERERKRSEDQAETIRCMAEVLDKIAEQLGVEKGDVDGIGERISGLIEAFKTHTAIIRQYEALAAGEAGRG